MYLYRESDQPSIVNTEVRRVSQQRLTTSSSGPEWQLIAMNYAANLYYKGTLFHQRNEQRPSVQLADIPPPK